MSDINVEEAAKILKLLGDKSRLTIMSLVMDHECCVCELVEILGMSQPAISQHIGKLKAATLIKERRKGQWIFYRINKESIYNPFVEAIIPLIPDQNEHIKELERKGLRINCCD